MTHFLKTALLATAALLATSNVHARAPQELSINAALRPATAVARQQIQVKEQTPCIKGNAKIGIARLDQGRLIAAPIAELRDWAYLNNRSNVKFDIISPAAHIKNIPEVPMMGGRDSDNKLDEIRMTASDLRMDYVLIYGMGMDARWGSFGGKAMIDTGFKLTNNQYAPAGRAKALLVNTYTGKILGTIVSEDIEFSIGDLTDKIEVLIHDLSA